jgi:hypothetical protein
LGLSFLSRHIVTFDFPNGRVYFEKGKEYKKVDETDMSGLHLLRISNETFVYSVDEGDIAKVEWKQWNIDLASLGAGLQNVTKLAIGIDGNGAGGT